MITSSRRAAASAALIVLAAGLHAAVPPLINYQGRLTTPGGQAISATRNMRFFLYTSAGATTPAWQEPPSTTASDEPVTVTNGLFNVLLGGYDPVNNPLPAS